MLSVTKVYYRKQDVYATTNLEIKCAFYNTNLNTNFSCECIDQMSTFQIVSDQLSSN